jgi:hypothetical protein
VQRLTSHMTRGGLSCLREIEEERKRKRKIERKKERKKEET